jgi:hypothetical protein
MLSEIDLKDWVHSATPEKLYNVKRGSLVSSVEQPDVVFNFHHIDGMYSLCQLLDGTYWNLAAWSDVYTWKKKV